MCGPAYVAEVMPKGLVPGHFFRSIPENFGRPSTSYFNPTTGPSPAFQRVNSVVRPSFALSHLGPPHIPVIVSDGPKFEDGWSSNAALARRRFESHLLLSALQMNPPANPFHNASACGFGVFKPSQLSQPRVDSMNKAIVNTESTLLIDLGVARECILN